MQIAAEVEVLSPGLQRCQLLLDDKPLSFADFLSGLQRSSGFREGFTHTLAAVSFAAFRWETPAISTALITRPFECVLHDAPGLAVEPDRKTFETQFGQADEDGIATFENLGGDATLIAPAPLDEKASYPHLADFLRSAPRDQIHGMWRTVGRITSEKLSEAPLWLSTAGGGVAWLHVRLDQRPKYYGHLPYADGDRE